MLSSCIQGAVMKQNRHGQAKILNSQEITQIFDALPGDRDRAIAAICLYTGCRISEACSLLSEDVYGGNGQPLSVVTIRKSNTKGKIATRQIPTHPTLSQHLQRYAPGERYCFPSRWHQWKSINPRSFDAILREAFEVAAIEGASTHSFRRTALTRLSASGVPLRVIQEISGHQSLNVLQKYLEVKPVDVEQAIAVMSF